MASVHPASAVARHTSTSKAKLAATVDLDDDALRGVPLPALLEVVNPNLPSRSDAVLAASASLCSVHLKGFRGAVCRARPTSGTGSERSFAKSKRVSHLDYFVSHSWSSPRSWKYVALLHHFNLNTALAVLLMVWWVGNSTELFLHERLPGWTKIDIPSQVDTQNLQGCCATFLLATPIFVLSAMLAHTGSEVNLFLDIACIRQDSDESKKQGVTNLGALLDRSEQMICLVDERYFTRLWCMFELATFYRRAGPERIVLIPMHVPLLLAASVVGLFVPNLIDVLIFKLLPDFADDALLFNLLGMLLNTPWMLAMLWAVVQAHKTEEAIKQLRSFSLEDAQCYSEADRENLLDLIGEWFTDRVGADETDEAGLRRIGWHRFETAVRNDLPRIIRQRYSVGIEAIVSTVWLSVFILWGLWNTAAIADPKCSVWQAGIAFGPIVGSLAFAPALKLGAWLILKLRPSVGVVCGYLVAYVPTVLGFLLANSISATTSTMAQNFDPAWRAPEDDLDPLSRKMVKFTGNTVAATLMLGLLYRQARR